jgi:hypothetical protein
MHIPKPPVRAEMVTTLALSTGYGLVGIFGTADYESEGREFESLRARHKIKQLPSYWFRYKS